MFEQSFENEDRYVQQGRRSHGPFSERRGFGRGYGSDDDRSDSQDRYRYRGQDSERRYTRPDYDSDLDIERPGQPRFGSRGSYDQSRDYDQEWSRPYRSSRAQDRYGYEGPGRFDYNRHSADNAYGRGMAEQGYGRGLSDWGRGGPTDYPREWSTGSGMGHADWNRYGSDEHSSGYGRRSFDQQGQQQSWNEQRNRWPKSYKRSDERLTDDIHEELIRHGRIDASDIEVSVKDGEVTLTGSVSSRQDKRTAEELAERVLGVHDVQNQLRVRSQSQTQQGQSQMGQGIGSQGLSPSSMGSDQQRSGSGPNLPGANRVSVAGQQQDQNRSAVNSTNK